MDHNDKKGDERDASNGVRKKILFVITKSNFGGAQRYVYDLATHLSHGEFEVAVACGPAQGGKPGKLSHMLDSKGIPTIEVPALQRDINPVHDLRTFFTLVGLFREEKPDVVHLNSSKAAGIGALAARLAGVPRIIVTLHGLPFDEKRHVFSRVLIMLATWLTLLLSHRTITISSDTLERMRYLPFAYKKVVLLHNGIEAPEFEPPADARKALRSIDPTIPEDGPLIGTIAELHPNKDLMLAIDAIALTAAHGVIIGDGELREKLVASAKEKNVADRVHFVGFVPDAARYLRAFDVFLLTSIKEGLPYALLEAAAAHVPIIAVDIPGVRDIVLHEFTGLLSPRDAQAIAAALDRALTDTALARSLTDEMGRRLQKSFSFAQMLEKTAALYQDQ